MLNTGLTIRHLTHSPSPHARIRPSGLRWNLRYFAALWSPLMTWFVKHTGIYITTMLILEDRELLTPKVNPLLYPHPPLLDSIWQGAKNCILRPALSALAGFTTAGPVESVLARATHVAERSGRRVCPTRVAQITAKSGISSAPNHLQNLLR